LLLIFVTISSLHFLFVAVLFLNFVVAFHSCRYTLLAAIFHYSRSTISK